MFSQNPGSLAERIAFRLDTRRSVDSLIDARLPVSKKVFSGVFVSPITESILPKYAPIPWHYMGLFEKAVWIASPQLPMPNLLFADRETKVAALNESVTLRNATVDGVEVEAIVINRVGYLVQADSTVYLVTLQYLSNQDQETLKTLERFFKSVRLRAGRDLKR